MRLFRYFWDGRPILRCINGAYRCINREGHVKGGERYPTEDEVSTAMETFGSWTKVSTAVDTCTSWTQINRPKWPELRRYDRIRHIAGG